jgi:transposase
VISVSKDAFKLIRPHCAGIDLGSESHYVGASVSGLEELALARFGCFTCDLVSMGLWLKERGVEHVAMEATGVYWVPVYEYLSSQGFKVVLVDGKAARQLQGRKSDVSDCQWLCQLHMHGLLRACHLPDEQMLGLRAYWRQRQRLVEQRAEQIQLMHKALEQMNCQVHKVLTDVSGVSGQRILRAIVDGERDPVRLSEMAHPRVKTKPEELQAALQGTWAEHHLFALSQALQSYDFFGLRIQECDKHVEALSGKISGNGPTQPRSKAPRKNQPNFDLRERVRQMLGGADPTCIDGIDESTAMTLIAELGTDLSGFPTEKHFASYLRQSPRNKITGGRIKSSRAGKTTSRAATALRLAAQGLHRSESALGAFYRRLKARIGPEKATTATARKIAMQYYRLVRYGVTYNDPGAEAYERQFHEQRVRWLTKQADKLGLVLMPAGAP